MTWTWDKEKIWVPDGNWTHDLPYTGRALYPLSHLPFTTTTSTLPFLVVCRRRVIHELSLMASLSMWSCGSVDRAPARCMGGHGFDSPRDSDFFFVSCLRQRPADWCKNMAELWDLWLKHQNWQSDSTPATSWSIKAMGPSGILPGGHILDPRGRGVYHLRFAAK